MTKMTVIHTDKLLIIPLLERSFFSVVLLYSAVPLATKKEVYDSDKIRCSTLSFR